MASHARWHRVAVSDVVKKAKILSKWNAKKPVTPPRSTPDIEEESSM